MVPHLGFFLLSLSSFVLISSMVSLCLMMSLFFASIFKGKFLMELGLSFSFFSRFSLISSEEATYEVRCLSRCCDERSERV